MSACPAIGFRHHPHGGGRRAAAWTTASSMASRSARDSGDQLGEIGSLIDSGVIRAVVERVFPFESTNEAMAYVARGRAKGKVVVKVR